MDVSLRSSPATDGARGRARRQRVPRVVLMLGFTSMLTDISSEMVTAILPIFLVLQLGLTPAQFGLVDGLYRGVSAVSRLAAGVISDWLRRPKLVASIGYGLSAATRPLLLAVSTVPGVAALISLDRVGKGIRTAPRDAMIATASPPRDLGYNFGVHRALDNAGAMLGPLLAFAILMLVPGRFDVVFVMSSAFAFLGLAVLVLLVPERAKRPAAKPTSAVPGGCRTAAARIAAGTPTVSGTSPGKVPSGEVPRGEVPSGEVPADACPRWGTALRCRTCGSTTPTATSAHDAPPLTRRDITGLVRSPQFVARVGIAGLLTVFTVSDAFLFLTLLDRNEDLATWFPLLAVGLGLAYAALAVPVGRLADRWGRMRVYLLGHVLLLAAYALAGGYSGGALPATILILLLMGLYYAATDGVLAASVSSALPEVSRSSGLALAQTVVALAAMVSSIAFGLLLTRLATDQAYLVMSLGMIAALVFAVLVLRHSAATGEPVSAGDAAADGGPTVTAR